MVHHLTPKIICKLCSKVIQNRQKRVNCQTCKSDLHLKCNKIENNKNYDKRSEIFMCIQCNKDILPFPEKNITNNDTNNHAISNDLKIFFNEINNLNLNHSDSNDEETDISPLLNCKYIDITSLNQQKVNEKSFSIIHLNIASLAKNKDEFEACLSLLKFKFDIIGISETKIKSNTQPIYELGMKGYSHFQTPSDANKGGVIIYVLDKHVSTPRQDLEKLMYKSKLLESCFVEIIVPNKKNIIVGCIYRHPSMNLCEFNNEHLKNLLAKLNNKKHSFLLGDFNIDLMKTDVDSYTTDYFDMLTSAQFVPHIIHPTRITNHSKTLIDNIFSNLPNFHQGFSGNLTLAISDHLAQVLIIPLDPPSKPKTTKKYMRDTKNFDRENFLLDLLEFDWDDIIQVDKNDPNTSFNQFYKHLSDLIDKYMPLRKLTNKEIKYHEKPWINRNILQAILIRDEIYKRFIQAKDPNRKAYYENNYKTARNKINNDIKQSKKDYYHQYFMNNANNIKNTWKGIKSIITLKSSRKSHSNNLYVNNKLVSDPREIGNTFNDYFSTIATKLQNKIYHHGKDFSSYLGNCNEHSFFIKPTDQTEVSEQIIALNPNKAEGPTSIPTDILKLIIPSISLPLSKIINLSFSTGVYIEKLKIAKVIPIFKEKGSELDHTNYRPISILSNINKIIEKLMHERLFSFLEKYNCIYNLQYGFRMNHSTNHCLLDLTESIRKALDNNKYAVGIFVDLQKAFDCVEHNILLSKLNHYGIRGISNQWFKSYLCNRRQYVEISGSKSNITSIRYGVPQGSVLGPLLFLLYINDLYKCVKFSTPRHFADDTNLLFINSSLKQMKKHINIDLALLSSWLRANKISLNVSKTEVLIFRHPNKPINYDLRIKLDGKRLYPAKYVKYLGILIDSHLDWSYHTTSLASKLSRAIGMLAKARHYIDKSAVRNLYFGIFSSLLTYGCQIWGQQQNYHIRRISKLQKKAIRIINFANFNASSSELFKRARILKLQDNITLLNFLYVYDSLKGQLPSNLMNSFEYIYSRHIHPTRISKMNCVNLPKSNTDRYGINSITSQSARNWNSLQVTLLKNSPLELKRNMNKKLIIEHLINSY